MSDTSSKPSRWRRWFTFSWSGLLGAVVFFCLSLTPSLLPRGPLLQGLVGGVLASIGYGIGILARWCIRFLFENEPTAKVMRIAWWVLAGVGAVLIIVFLGLGAQWQAEIHRLVNEPEPDATSPLVIVIVAALIGFFLLVCGRGVRRFFRWVTRIASRRLPRKVSIAIGVVASTLLVLLVLQGIVFDSFIAIANEVSSVNNGTTSPGISRNPSPLVSGGDGSLIKWDSIGREGRDFIGGGPSVDDLTAFSNSPARQPIRVYAGIESAPTIRQRARLAVRELDRTNAWSRKVLLVVTTTGSGWVNANGAYPLEYMYNGDTATVSMQYSYLPSWISFLADRSKAREAGRALFNEVYQAWAEKPEATRPKLLLYGESLGSYGTEAAFSGEADMKLRTNGVLLVGPPQVNPLHREFTSDRDRDSPAWLPVYQNGRTIRFVANPPDLDRPDAPWPGTRVVYLQHASDPIVFWTPRLILRKPDWLREQRGPDVSPATRWFPFVTFFQVTVDMMFSNSVPPGHGHRYGTLTVDAWRKIAPPADWSDAKNDQLKQVLVTRGWTAS